MYTRNYYTDSTGEISIPENYDGTALRESTVEKISEPPEDPSAAYIENTYSEPTKKEESAPVFKQDKPRDEAGFLSWIKKLPFKFSQIETREPLKSVFLDFGTEEILIIGIALFLIFSGSHDIECAVMMLLLLFIK